jgi:hypothetical protein
MPIHPDFSNCIQPIPNPSLPLVAQHKALQLP